MSERTYDSSLAQPETSGVDPGLVSATGAPNGAHRWIRLQGLSGAMGNSSGQELLEQAGSWASTPYWQRGTGQDLEVAKARGATPDLLVRRDGGRVLVIRAPLGYQTNAVLVDLMFEDLGAEGCAPYEVVTETDPNYILYLVLVLDREGKDWSGYEPSLAERIMAALVPGEILYDVPPEGENSLSASYPTGWGENETEDDLWPGAPWSDEEVAPSMAGLTPGPWAPPGNQPAPLYVGREVHEAIAREYVETHGLDRVFTNSMSIGSMLDFTGNATPNKLSAQERLLKPDIANLTRLHLYEIKSEAEAPAGAAKLATYLAVFNAAGVPMQAGPVTEPGTMGVLPAPAGFVLYHCLTPGLIVYRYRKALPEPLPIGIPEPKGMRDWVRRITDWRYWEEVTGLTGTALVLYLLVSEGSRVVPARNLLPVP